MVFWTVSAFAQTMTLEVVTEVPVRKRIETAICRVDGEGDLHLLAQTENGMETWKEGGEWWTAVEGVHHSGAVTGSDAMAFARWKADGTGAEIGVVGIDGIVHWRKDFRVISNTTTEVAAFVADDHVTFAVKFHTNRSAWIGHEEPGLDAHFEDAQRVPVRNDPVELTFVPDGTRFLVAGNGTVSIANVGNQDSVMIDDEREQRGARLSRDGSAVVFGVPNGDRSRLAKANTTSGARIWLSEDLSAGREDSWGVQALDFLPTVGAWLVVIDDQLIAIRDADGVVIPWRDGTESNLIESQWKSYDQLYEWFRPPALVAACGDDRVVVSNLAGRMQVLRAVAQGPPTPQKRSRRRQRADE